MEDLRRGRGAERYNWRSSSGSGRKWANPTDESRQSTKCFICKSMYHWAKDCPNQTEEGQNHNSYYEEEVHVTLFAKGLSEQSTSQLLGETMGCAVIDVAEMCVQTNGYTVLSRVLMKKNKIKSNTKTATRNFDLVTIACTTL